MNFEVPPILTYTIPFFFVLIAFELILQRLKFRKLKKHYRFNDSVASLSTGILSQISGVFFGIIGISIYIYIYKSFALMEMSLASVPAWIACFILKDFLYYVFHRISHSVNFLWGAHVVHHQSEDFNLIVALRQTSTGNFFAWIFYTPMAFMGFPPWMYLACSQLNLIYQFWVHTQYINKMYPLIEFLFVTPSHHRVHHATNPQYIDRNHGGVFIIWDRMFGSFAEEKKKNEVVYGTVGGLKSWNPLWANFQWFWILIQQSLQTKGILNKIKVWIKPPGWYVKKNGKEALSKIPKVSVKTFKKYNATASSVLMRSYVLIWFILTVITAFYFLLFQKSFALDMKLIYVIWIILSITSLCAVLEKKSWFRFTEVFRLFFLIYFSYYVSQDIYVMVGVSGLSIPSLISISFGYKNFL